MIQSERTRELLIMHCHVYPKLKVQDVFKFLYQSSFGCEHLVYSLEIATDDISKEYENICNEATYIIEKLDGSYSRVPLSYLNQGLSAETFGKLLVASAKKETNGLYDLVQKLKIAKEIASEGLLPFTQNEFENSVKEWEANGYPSIHHSDVFKEAYKPSYRVIANKYVPFLPLFVEIDNRLAKGTVKVAIEGGSAGGKTTLSNILSSVYDCTVFHMDDFFLRPEQRTSKRYTEVGGNIDRERFLLEVLQPLSEGKMINYQRFDCSTMGMGDMVQVVPKKLIVIEGAYSMHPELERYYDFSVFLDISSELQKARILKRNSPKLAKRFFEEWIPLEKKYFSIMKIKEHCDMQISIT